MSSRILIVEDEQITAEDLAEILKHLGYEISGIVSSGKEAIHAAEQNRPDLVLMDIRIKGELDGTETALILRERFDVPVVYLTAHADAETLQRAKQSRPMGYIVKPFHEAELHASVEIALHKQAQEGKDMGRGQHMRDVLGALSLAIISIDQTEKILMVNRAAEALSGFRDDEAAGRPFSEIFRLTDAANGKETDLTLKAVLVHRSLLEIRQGFLLTKSGVSKPVSGNVAPLRGPDGRPAGAVIVLEAADAAPHPGLDSRTSRNDQGYVVEFGRFRLIAASEPMKQVLSFAARVARSQATTVLLEGESGTGKDLIAQFLHYNSDRSGKPFVAFNCSAIPETLIESELFGREPGAYTDARTRKKGLLEVAHGGTLFLDEVGDLSPAVQSKFLRVLEQQSFRRLGGLEDIEMNLRVIAATNRDLPEAVHSGAFRLDLFHRLSVIQIASLPLREHPGDILPLALHFIQEYGCRYKVDIREISPAAEKLLHAYDWPGNVRELRNVIERAVLLEETNALRPASIKFAAPRALSSGGVRSPARLQTTQPELSLKTSERLLMVQALEKSGGNKTKAAKLLGISRDVLRYRMKRLK